MRISLPLTADLSTCRFGIFTLNTPQLQVSSWVARSYANSLYAVSTRFAVRSSGLAFGLALAVRPAGAADIRGQGWAQALGHRLSNAMPP